MAAMTLSRAMRALVAQTVSSEMTRPVSAPATSEATCTSSRNERPASSAPVTWLAMRVMAVSTGEADELIEGSTRYRIKDGEDALGFTVSQAHEDATITARSMAAVREQLSTEVSAGLEIEVLSIGGSVATESEQTREFETSVEWKVRYGRNTFEFQGDTD